MLFKKILQLSVDMTSAQDIYAPDIEALLISKLEAKFKNKCYQAMLIKKVTRLLRYSDTNFSDNKIDASAYVNVQFEVEGIRLLPGEILHNCKVVEIQPGNLFIEHEHAGGIVNPDPKNKVFQLVKKDQHISVVIKNARYNPNQSQISIAGFVYAPVMPQQVYYLVNNEGYDEAKLTAVIADLEEEIKKHNELNETKNSSYGFFKNLVYFYKTAQKYEMSKIGSGSKQFIIDSKIATTDYTSRILVSPNESYNSINLAVYTLPIDKMQVIKDAGLLLVSGDLYTILSDIIGKKMMYLKNLRNFAEEYNNLEKTQGRMTFWQQCNAVKE